MPKRLCRLCAHSAGQTGTDALWPLKLSVDSEGQRSAEAEATLLSNRHADARARRDYGWALRHELRSNCEYRIAADDSRSD